VTNVAAALPGRYQITKLPSPVLNHQRSADMRCYWIMLFFNSPVTKYRYGNIRR
jgi:hypothetical protein